MTQKTTGLLACLSSPFVYQLFQTCTGADHFRKRITRQYICPKSSERILDIGCGPADILEYFPADVDYWGYDSSEDYINAAKKRFGTKGNFRAHYFDEQTALDIGQFDKIMAIGLVHHLDDEPATHLFTLAKSALKPNGKLITVDPCFLDQQSPIARWIISHDRGQNVRTQNAYLELAQQTFEQIDYKIHDDLLYIPYNQIVMQCTAKQLSANFVIENPREHAF